MFRKLPDLYIIHVNIDFVTGDDVCQSFGLVSDP